jgi:hypothetical protein
VNGIKIDRKELTDGDKIMVDAGTPPELPSAAPPTAGRPAASGGCTDAMTGSIAYRHPVRYLPQQPPRFGDIASVERRQRSRDQGACTPTLLGRRRSLRSVRHRRKSAIFRVVSLAVRPCPALSGRRPHLQVPSTPQVKLRKPLRIVRSHHFCCHVVATGFANRADGSPGGVLADRDVCTSESPITTRVRPALGSLSWVLPSSRDASRRCGCARRSRDTTSKPPRAWGKRSRGA